MMIFLSVYGIIAFIIFMFFAFPVFQYRNCYLAEEAGICLLFSIGMGLIWPVVISCLTVFICCDLYYSRKACLNKSVHREDRHR